MGDQVPAFAMYENKIIDHFMIVSQREDVLPVSPNTPTVRLAA